MGLRQERRKKKEPQPLDIEEKKKPKVELDIEKPIADVQVDHEKVKETGEESMQEEQKVTDLEESGGVQSKIQVETKEVPNNNWEMQAKESQEEKEKVEAVGYASLWGAVLADVGTCLLVIFNSMLLLERKKDESRCLGLFAFRRKHRSKVCQKYVLLRSEKYVDLEAEPWYPKKMEDTRDSAHGTKQENEYYLSYCATKSCCDVTGANNGMRQRVNNRDAYKKYCQCIAIDEGLLVSSDVADVGSEDFSSKEGRHVEVESDPICHLDKHEDKQDMILQYYSKEWGHSKESGQMDVTGRSNLDLGPLAHLGVWALKFASVQSYKHFIAVFQNCSFNNTYLLEATKENKVKVLRKDFGGWAKTKEADDSV
ncbi:hypothetical protein L7F22_054531 [Adiantum nelumboides]|nr:hypothetical protein [Adiantum nelumboides]